MAGAGGHTEGEAPGSRAQQGAAIVSAASTSGGLLRTSTEPSMDPMWRTSSEASMYPSGIRSKYAAAIAEQSAAIVSAGKDPSEIRFAVAVAVAEETAARESATAASTSGGLRRTSSEPSMDPNDLRSKLATDAKETPISGAHVDDGGTETSGDTSSSSLRFGKLVIHMTNLC